MIEAVIRGEFPSFDPRGRLKGELSGGILTGFLTDRSGSEVAPIFLNLVRGTYGTMNHRFALAGTKDDNVILIASQDFIESILNDDRERVAELILFPIQISFGGESIDIESLEVFYEKYDDIFDAELKERLANTFPNNLMANAGNFIGTIGQLINGGGGILYNQDGKVIEIYSYTSPTPTPVPSLTPTPP